MPHPTIPYVLAAPGYIAGGGDWQHLTELLHRGHGWKDISTVDTHTVLAGPDGSLQVSLDRRTWKWSLHAAPAGGRHWSAVLGAHIPVEYITDLVVAMQEPGPRRAPAVLGPLHAAGWATDPAASAATAVSPDGLVRITGEPGPSPWYAVCAVGDFTWWTASFSPRTPPAVVTAFTRRLADDNPLPRMAIGVPMYGCERHTRLTRTPYTTDQERADLEARIAEARDRRRTPRPLPPARPHHHPSRTR
ncbi:DUF317 domain-containing protein [Streptomyces sp. NPDC056716]|uniref:DUF317 domain-containing protein n=1 Tax=unclassified Streptomyces TaxID=2593676 RepID=UPI0036D07D4F